MGNMCCRREIYTPNGTDTDQSRCGHQQHHTRQQHLSKQPQQHPAMSSAYHSAGDDCAINELLEGRMDLDVLMPDGRKMRLTVERRTPMMDLLVQAASATKISPGGHVIHVFGDGDKGNGALQYKPSTPIGSLDTKTICIVPKKESGDPFARRLGKTANRPFEPTFRVQVHLPRNQLTVLRVSPRIKISELKSMVCKEKGLDTTRYQLVRPSGPAQPLSGDMTLAEYGSTEITLLSNSSIEAHICNSTSHIIPYSKRTEEPKRRNGILKLLTEDANNKANETINCNSVSRVDGSQRNNANKQEEAHVHRYKPKKRRPAPPPPPPILPEAPSHSRQSSSDSSGYHEATSSFLHEEHSSEEKASSDSSGVSSLDVKGGPSMQQQPSPPLPVPNSKKKKAPPPPPPVQQKEKPTHRAAPSPPTQNNNSALQKASVILKDSTTTSEKADVPSEGEDTVLRRNKDINPTTTEQQKDAVKNYINLTDSSAKDIRTTTEQQKDAVKNYINLTDSSAKDIVEDYIIPTDSSAKDIVKNCIIPMESTARDPVVVLLQQTVENKLSAESSAPLSGKGPSLATEFTITPYSESKRDPIIRDNAGVILKDNLVVRKDYLPRENIITNSHIVRDQIIVKNHVIPTTDQVLKQDTDEKKKLDLHHFRDGEGQLQMTVAAKAPSAANVSTDPVKVKQSKCGTPLSSAKENKEATSLVPDTHRYRTPEKRVEKDRLPCKGEAVSTRVALVALNARIEQDVTQQEIASSIQAAFHSVDCTPQQPSLLAIKQRNNEDSNVRSAARDSSSLEELLPTPSAVKVSSNLDFGKDKDHRNEISPEEAANNKKFGDLEREALLIDEEPPPSRRPVLHGGCAPSKNLRRSSSLLSFTDVAPRGGASFSNTKRARHLQRSLSDLSTDGKEDFETEQERLQREYIKLQRQFILWQQQLMSNHAMLREECIVPQYARTLRQSHSLPEGEDSFEENTPSVPLVSRSLSYEPTKDRCSTLPRSAINITSLEFGSMPLGNGTSTLRSSKTKSYFKPPQIRASTKSRQRLPPEIKKEGDVDITDDTKMLTTILPSFESLKLITENSEDAHFGISRLKDTIPTAKSATTTAPSSEGRKIPVVHLSSTFPKLNSRLNNGDRGAADRDLKLVNGDTGQSKILRQGDCSTEQSVKSQLSPPPPPPPMPAVSVSKYSVSENSTTTTVKSTGQRNGVGKKDFTPEVDPREKLMLEIRKCGGRTALRKISLAS